RSSRPRVVSITAVTGFRPDRLTGSKTGQPSWSRQDGPQGQGPRPPARWSTARAGLPIGAPVDETAPPVRQAAEWTRVRCRVPLTYRSWSSDTGGVVLLE
ncbi:MAG: hypothetical protein ACREA0_19310, partial [bacterium]